MGTNKRTARLAGLIWLLMFVFGPIAQIVRSKLFVAGDMVATAQNIMSNENLFRMGFVSDLMMMALFLLLPLVLYKLFHNVDKNLSILMVILVMVSVPINMLNLLNEYAAFQVLSGTEYLGVFGAEQLMAQAMLSYDLYLHGYEIANVFFALWLIPLGLLVYKSVFLPRILGILLVVGGCSLFLEVFLHFLLPGFETVNMILLIPQTLSEFAFLVWVLIRGINESKGTAARRIESIA
ncbi:MAG: DUF4386 domain-containing protein [Firmicutes bacterium HGW-Firmicutes-11]|jgi:hypothetical protein|nr:MAG: DUF4386 domain-containing protein [Firmicutes bacterium HGW-Firmicutes-11]